MKKVKVRQIIGINIMIICYMSYYVNIDFMDLPVSKILAACGIIIGNLLMGL